MVEPAPLDRSEVDARLRAEILAFRTIAERLGAWIAAKGEFPPKGTWKTVAQEIGTSPESLYREIARRVWKSGALKPALLLLHRNDSGR